MCILWGSTQHLCCINTRKRQVICNTFSEEDRVSHDFDLVLKDAWCSSKCIYNIVSICACIFFAQDYKCKTVDGSSGYKETWHTISEKQ